MLFRPIKAFISFVARTFLTALIIAFIYIASTGKTDTLINALKNLASSDIVKEWTSKIITPVSQDEASGTGSHIGTNSNSKDLSQNGQNSPSAAGTNPGQTDDSFQTITFNSKDKLLTFFVPWPKDKIETAPADPTILTKVPDYHSIKIRVNLDEPIFLRCKVLNTPTSRNLGYMYTPSISDYECRVFAFKKDTTTPFYMKNVNFALDILFFDKDMHLLHAIKSAPPCKGEKAKNNQCPLYFAPKPYRYVIELKPGVIKLQ